MGDHFRGTEWKAARQNVAFTGTILPSQCVCFPFLVKSGGEGETYLLLQLGESLWIKALNKVSSLVSISSNVRAGVARDHWGARHWGSCLLLWWWFVCAVVDSYSTTGVCGSVQRTVYRKQHKTGPCFEEVTTICTKRNNRQGEWGTGKGTRVGQSV